MCLFQAQLTAKNLTLDLSHKPKPKSFILQERETEGERDRGRETEGEIQRERDGKRETGRERQRERETGRESQTEGERWRERDRERETETGEREQRDRQRERQGERQKDFDVEEYFDKVINGVSNKWDDLARKLGFNENEIKGIRTDETLKPDQDHRCREVLHRWRNREGREATLQVLKQALIDIDERATAESLEELQEPQPSTSKLKRKEEHREQTPGQKSKKPRTESDSEDGESHEEDLFQKSVKRRYELKLTHFKPLIWNDDFTLSLSDIFTQLELIQKSKHKRSESMRGEERKELKSLDDLFKTDVTGLSTAPRCILIEGEAGGGKTTFLSKEALDAISQKTELGRRHDIVLLIRLREVREGETIEEMVWDQCVDETTEGIEAQSIRTILQRNKSHVLFLLDGYDELRPEARAAGQAIPKLLSGKMYPNSTIVITSRPSAGVQQYTRPDCHVHIMGFSPEHATKHVKTYFSITGSPELGEDFIKQYFIVSHDDEEEKVENTVRLKDNELLKNLIQTPMFLILLCLLWEEDQEMVSTGTMMGLYDNLLTCLVRKCCEREGVDMPTEGLPTDVAESLLQLGKLALEALLRNETLLDLTEVKREKVNWELLLKLGVVSLEVSSAKLHPRKQLNFSHKTMQEFLAGRYVAHAQVNQDIVELLQLTCISKALELSNLLQFTSGCGSQATQAVMEELSKLSSREFAHLKPEQFESSNVPKDPDVQKSCQTYRRFVHLCLNILSERQEPEVLQGISQALPIVMLNSSINSREATGLKYYIQNLHSANLPDRLILKICGDRDTVQYLQQCFTTSLPGLKLDLKLAWVQFDSPDLTARLVSVLKNVPCLRVLDLSYTKLTPSSLQPLVQGFRHMSLLEELDLTENRALGDAGMEVLQVGLSSVPHLAVLRLRFVGMTAVGMSSLAPCMRHLVGLRELDISGNGIGDTGLESLTTLLHTFTAMQVLELRRTGISPTGMRTLVPALCKLTRLIKLDISENAIGDPGLECLAAILHHLTAMKVLVLSETGISHRGISLIKALPHLVQLQVLDVRCNNIGDSGIVSLVQTLCQPSSLDMEQNPPGDKSLTTAPHYNTTLQELYIGWNRGVTGAGLGRVAQVISTLPALTRLDMSGPLDTPAHLSDTAAMDLAEVLPRLPALEGLDLDRISMEPAGFQAVVQAAEEHPTLETLLYSRKLVPEGADTTAKCLVLWNF
ncbi:Nlrc4p [Branchiostoma belcheri]|nr:Nlrc4p [Branchiostoma belcheri]